MSALSEIVAWDFFSLVIESVPAVIRVPKSSLAVFVMPPSIEVLRQRLLSRGTETPESVEKRLQRADYEISFSKQFDYVLVNDDLETAIREAYNLVNGFLIR